MAFPEIRFCHKRTQVSISFGVFYEEDNHTVIIQSDLCSDYWLDTTKKRLFVEFNAPSDIVAICESNRGHVVPDSLLDNFAYRCCAIQKGEVTVTVKVYEGCSHVFLCGSNSAA